MHKKKEFQKREASSTSTHNPPPIRALIIEDDPEDAQLLREMLAQAKGIRFNVRWADRLQAGMECLSKGGIDVLLLDLSLPDSVGLETVLTVHSRASGVPIVVMTGLDDEALAMEAVRKGAQDYLVKGHVDAHLLVRSIRYAIERKRGEEAIRESEERFRTLVTAAPIGLSIIAKDGTYEYVNPKFIDIFGYSLEDVSTGEKWFEKAYPDPAYRNKVITSWIEDLREEKVGETRPRVFTVMCKDGSGKEIFFRPVSLTDGKQLVTYEDITERKRAEEALRESEEKFRTLSEQSPNMIFINKKGRVVYANKKCEKLMGYGREEFYESDFDFLTLMAPESIEIVQSSYVKHMRGEEVEPYEYSLLTKNGKSIEAILNTALIDYEGEKAILGTVTDITERKRAEKAIRESEERFRQLAENIHEVFWMSDPKKSEMIYVSPAYEEIWERTCKSLYEQSRSFLDTIHPEDRGHVLATFDKQRRGEFIEVEYRIVRPDGSTRWIRSRAFPIRNERGEFYRIAGLAEDITERKGAQEALRKSKELFEKTFKSQRDAIFLLDAGIPPTILDCNPAATEIFGHTRQEMLGRTTALLHVDERALRKFQKHLYPAISDRGYAYLPEFEMKRKNGPVFPTELSVMPLEGEKGERMGWMSVVRDITERKRTEEQLHKYANDLEKMVSERTAELTNTTNFLNNILDSSTEYAIVATDLKGTILNWNTGARNIFSYDAEEVIEKVNVDIIYDKSFLHANKNKNILMAAIDAKTNNADFNNLTLIRKNGESFPADITATFLRDAQGKKIGTLGIIRDVTERKMLERQLIQSEKMAGIGTLAAGIAHEVRNPLSIINTSTYLLKDEIFGKTEEAENLLRQIEGGVKRTQTIINNLLDFSRPAVDELESVDLKKLLEQILSLDGRSISTQNINLKSDFKDVPKVLANLDSLKHMFLNLLINAVHSMPDGGILGIKTYQEDERIMVEISDTGVGIAEKDLPKIFDPFFTTKEPGKGTGLGLAFVHSEIEKMGAKIRVNSTPTVGSTFIVEFPLR